MIIAGTSASGKLCTNGTLVQREVIGIDGLRHPEQIPTWPLGQVLC